MRCCESSLSTRRSEQPLLTIFRDLELSCMLPYGFRMTSASSSSNHPYILRYMFIALNVPLRDTVGAMKVLIWIWAIRETAEATLRALC
jgi:hypothetical protein